MRAPQLADGWSPREEQIIAELQHVESVPRAEAIRRMRRRKLDDLRGRTRSQAEFLADLGRSLQSDRLCQNPSCTRGDGGTPASLAHLRADARYCSDVCKKAGQRSPNREK